MADEKAAPAVEDPFELSAEDKAYFETGGEDKPEDKPPAKAEDKPEDKPSGRDEKGRFVAKDKDEPKAEEKVEEEAKPDAKPSGSNIRLRNELKAEREARSKLETRMNALLENMQRPAQRPEPPKPPDPEKDPLGALKFMQQQETERQQREAQSAHLARQRAAQQNEVQTAVREARTDFQAELAEAPDLGEAYTHLRQMRGAQLMAFGHSQDEANEILAREEVQAIFMAKRAGMTYPALVRAYAKASGWGPKPKQQEQPSNQDLGDKLDKLAKLQAKNKSLSDAGGGEKNLSWSDIDQMSDDEYSAWLDSPKGKAEWRKMNGVA